MNLFKESFKRFYHDSSLLPLCVFLSGCILQLAPSSADHSAAQHGLDLFPESLTQKGIDKRVDGRIDHDHCGRSNINYISKDVCADMKHKDIAY